MFTMMYACMNVYVHTYVIELCLVSTQRVLVQATGSAQKGGQVQQLSVPRVQQVPQQVHSTINSAVKILVHPLKLNSFYSN